MTRHDSPERDPSDPLEALLGSAAWPEPSRERLTRLEDRWRAVSMAQRPGGTGLPVFLRPFGVVLHYPARWCVACLRVAAAVAVSLTSATVSKSTGKPVAPGQQAALSRRGGTGLPVFLRPLDAVLHCPTRWCAAWVRVAAAVLASLAPATSSKNTGKPLCLTAVAVLAASVAVVAFWILEHPSSPRGGSVAVGPKTTLPARQPRADRPAVEPKRPAARPESVEPISRPATDFEKLIVQLHTSRRGAASVVAGDTTKPLAGPAQTGNPRESEPPARVPALADEGPVHRLALWIEQLSGPYRQAAVRAFREQEFDFQESLFFELLRRGDPWSVETSLRLVERNRPALAAALAAVGRLERPPVERLLASLGSPRVADRLAAAEMLGPIDDPRITEWLIATACRSVPREEILTALMCRCDEKAQQFVASASQNPMLRASMLAVSRRLERAPSL